MKRKIDAAQLLAKGPIDLVGHGAEAVRAPGYSTIELERANLTVEKAQQLGIPIDLARSSGVGANVMRLRRLLASSGSATT